VRRAFLAALALTVAAAPAAARDLPDRRAILEARDEVFARPEFAQRVREGESMLMTILREVADYVLRFREDNPVLYMVLMGFLVVTLVVLVAHIVWTIVVARRARYLPEPELPELDIRRTPPEEFRARALRLASEGRFEDAVRDLYTALILTLDQRGDLRYARHKALLDYRHEVRAEDARGALDRFAGGYHPTSFGRRPLPDERFRDLLARLDEVRG
jgi:hypothetical protein